MLTTITLLAAAWLWLFWEAKNAPQDPSEIGETILNENKI